MGSLQINDLTVCYGTATALRNVSVEAREGQTTAILGANGAGKSTLLRAVMGLVRAAAGSVRLDDVEITGEGVADTARRGIALVPEGRSLFTSLTVQENLAVGAAHPRPGAGSAEERIEAVYEFFPSLRGRERTPATMLSGGEQQMVAIGRALVANPSVMMLDEPSFGLAPKLVEQVLETIDRLRQAGTTIVLVEQNARAALEIADRGYVLHSGRVEVAGDAAELTSLDSVQRAYFGGYAA